MIITIDGPAGSGKSSIAINLEKSLKLEYKDKFKEKYNFEVLDTGAIFRSFTIYLTENFENIALLPEEIDEEKNKELKKELKDLLLKIDFKIEKNKANDQTKYILFGKDITKDIRDPEKMEYLSKVSANSSVREKILEIERNYALGKNIIVEGRDTGSVVFKNAEYKFYLTADIKERALRRYLQENENKNEKFDLEKYNKTLKELKIRDKKDMTRKIAPLIVPKDAILLDNTNETIDETTLKILKLVFNNSDK